MTTLIKDSLIENSACLRKVEEDTNKIVVKQGFSLNGKIEKSMFNTMELLIKINSDK